MRVSLIMPTIGRTDELKLFLESLVKQTYKNFELIIVDQNENDILKEDIDEYSKYFDILHIKNKEKGISVNRNKGLIYRKGNIIAFPDDDCEYKNDTIEKAVNYLKLNSKTIYTCRTLEKGKDYGTGKMLTENTKLKYSNVEDTVKSITFFVNVEGEDINLFDTKLGVGASFGSGEETDYVLNLLHLGYKGYYFADDIIYHPAKKGNYDDLERAYNYALGYGALSKKEIVYRKNILYIFKYLKRVFRNLGGAIISKHKEYHGEVLKGRLVGFFKYKR